jgi:hypothetical protein
MSIDNAITCCGKSWGSECQICEEQAYRDYIQEMRDDWDSGRDNDNDDEGGDE